MLSQLSQTGRATVTDMTVQVPVLAGGIKRASGSNGCRWAAAAEPGLSRSSTVGAADSWLYDVLNPLAGGEAMTTQARQQSESIWDISPGAYGALSEALSVIYWNKPAFHRFLRAFLRDHPELLAGIDFGGPKREAADEIVDRLMADEPRYHDLTWGLMDDVASRDAFPNLAQQTNADFLVEQARAAVAELRRYTTDHAAQQRAEDEFVQELADFREKNRNVQTFARTLEALKAEFIGMTADTSDAQQRGLDFETFLYKIFALFDLEPRLKYSLEYEQIDGAMSFDTDDYIIEAKWWKPRVEPGGTRRSGESKVERKAKNTMGLFISISGFTSGALEAYRERTPLITRGRGRPVLRPRPARAAGRASEAQEAARQRDRKLPLPCA
jgi:hypothetical protein